MSMGFIWRHREALDAPEAEPSLHSPVKRHLIAYYRCVTAPW